MSIEYEWKKRNKRLKIALSIVTILDILFGSSFAFTYYNYSVDSNVQTALNLRNQLSLSQTTVTNQQQTILRDNSTIRALNDEVKKLNTEVNSLIGQVNTSQGQLNEANRKIRELELVLVTLSGTVKTTGAGTYPKKINFESPGVKSIVDVNGTGGYSVRLPNFQIYKVTIDWGFGDPRVGAGGSNEAKESPFNLQSSAKSMTKDFSA